MGIAFNAIPLVVNTPGMFVEFDSSRAARGLAPIPHVALLIGQKLAGGTAPAGAPTQVASPAQAIRLFGQHSQLAQQVAAYKAVDPLTELWAIALADSGTAKAAGSITWTGTATEAGELALYVSGRRVAVAVSVGMTAAELETAALAAFAAQGDLPVVAAANAGTGVDLTARHAGTAGNGILLGLALGPGEHTPAGLTFTIVQPTGGAVDPDHAAAVTVMGEDQYHTIAIGVNASTEVAKLVTELESRWGPMRAIDGQLFVAKSGDKATVQTEGGLYNSLTLSLVGIEASAYSPAPWEVAARAAAADATQTKSDPSRARTGLLMGGNSAPRGARWSRAERDQLLGHGVSTTLAASDGRMQVERLITTYQTNGLGIPDQAFMDVFSVRTLSALRYTLRARIGTKFARFKLADDGNEVPGQPIVTPRILRSEIVAWYRECAQDRGWVENVKAFEDQLIVERDASDPNRVNALLPPDLINNFLVGAFQIAFQR